MVGAYDFDTDETVISVGLRNRKTGSMFACEVTIHHRGDSVVHVAFPEHWRQAVRNAGVDPYTRLGEKFLSLAARWRFLQSRVVHAPGCSALKCQARYRFRDAVFPCDRCGRVVGWCMGVERDNGDEICDDCWGDDSEAIELSRVRAASLRNTSPVEADFIVELDRALARANAELLAREAS